jgi:hypothetical protein
MEGLRFLTKMGLDHLRLVHADGGAVFRKLGSDHVDGLLVGDERHERSPASIFSFTPG